MGRRLDSLDFLLLLSLIDFSQAEHVSGREQTRFCSFPIDLPDLAYVSQFTATVAAARWEGASGGWLKLSLSSDSQ